MGLPTTVIAAHMHHTTQSPIHGHHVRRTHLHYAMAQAIPRLSSATSRYDPPRLCSGMQSILPLLGYAASSARACHLHTGSLPLLWQQLLGLCSGMHPTLPLLRHAIRPTSAWVGSTISESIPLAHWLPALLWHATSLPLLWHAIHPNLD